MVLTRNHRPNKLHCTCGLCLDTLEPDTPRSCCCCCRIASVVPDPGRPHRRQPTRLPAPGILQARTLEWVAISFSNAWKWKVKVKPVSRVRLLATPCSAAHQAPPSMGLSRQKYWSGVPLPEAKIQTTHLSFSPHGATKGPQGQWPDLAPHLQPDPHKHAWAKAHMENISNGSAELGASGESNPLQLGEVSLHEGGKKTDLNACFSHNDSNVTFLSMPSSAISWESRLSRAPLSFSSSPSRSVVSIRMTCKSTEKQNVKANSLKNSNSKHQVFHTKPQSSCLPCQLELQPMERFEILR